MEVEKEKLYIDAMIAMACEDAPAEWRTWIAKNMREACRMGRDMGEQRERDRALALVEALEEIASDNGGAPWEIAFGDLQSIAKEALAKYMESK